MVVTIDYDGDDDTETFLLGSREEGAHGDLEVNSPQSPLGRAILGARAARPASTRCPTAAA